MSQVGTWQTPFVHRFDLPKKWSNETNIFDAPDYAEVDIWEKIQLVDPDSEATPEAEE